MLIIDLLEHTAVSVELKKEMLAVRHRTVCLVSPPFIPYCAQNLDFLFLQKTGDGRKLYLSVIRKIVHYVDKLPPCDYEDVDECDISQILAEIESKEQVIETHYPVRGRPGPTVNAELVLVSTSSTSENPGGLPASSICPNTFTEAGKQARVAASPSYDHTAARAPGSPTPRKIPASRASRATPLVHRAGHRRANAQPTPKAASASVRPGAAPPVPLGSCARAPESGTPSSPRVVSPSPTGACANITTRGLSFRNPRASSRSSTRPATGAPADEYPSAPSAPSASRPSRTNGGGAVAHGTTSSVSSAPIRADSVSAIVAGTRSAVRERRNRVSGAGPRSVEAKAVARGAPVASPSPRKPAWK